VFLSEREKFVIERTTYKIRDERRHNSTLRKRSVTATTDLRDHRRCLGSKFERVVREDAGDTADVNSGEKLFQVEID
jgi:hypothetical protein